VLDEKMKDDVKITVIATGFKNDHPQRRERTFGVVEAVSTARATSSYAPGPQVVMQQRPAPSAEREMVAEDVHSTFEEQAPEPVGVAMAAAASSMSSRQVAPVRDSMSLDAVRNSVNGIDGDDLDVPAFMRKRADN